MRASKQNLICKDCEYIALDVDLLDKQDDGWHIDGYGVLANRNPPVREHRALCPNCNPDSEQTRATDETSSDDDDKDDESGGGSNRITKRRPEDTQYSDVYSYLGTSVM